MENQNLDTLKEVKTIFTVETVKTNLINALTEIKALCEQREYVVRGSIDNIIESINLEGSTLSSRKKLARKTYFFLKKKNRRTMSSLIAFVKRKFLIEGYEISIKPSLLEQEIVKMREEYKKISEDKEKLRLTLKEKKKLFFEKSK